MERASDKYLEIAEECSSGERFGSQETEIAPVGGGYREGLRGLDQRRNE